MNSKTKSSRQSIKDSSTSTIRQSMNQRRHDLSSKIRKTRRTHQIQLKRRLTTISTTTSTTTSTDSSAHIGIASTAATTSPPFASPSPSLPIQEVIQVFLSNPNEQALNELQRSFSLLNQEDVISKLLLKDHPQKGRELLSIFHSILIQSNDASNVASNVDPLNVNPLYGDPSKLQVLRILTNLAATTTKEETYSHNNDNGDDKDNDSYYGPSSSSYSHPPTQSWCELIICNMLSTSLIPCLHMHLFDNNNNNNNNNNNLQQLHIISQTCWVIGNLAGDNLPLSSSSSTATTTTTTTTTRMYMIQQSNVIHELIQVLKHFLLLLNQITITITNMSSINNDKNNNNNANNNMEKIIIETIRNSLWALSNLARGSTTSALLFLGSSSSISSSSSSTNNNNGLTSLEIISILEQVDNLNRNTDIGTDTGTDASTNIVSWREIHVELYWLLAFLTAREDEVIGLLFSDHHQQQQQHQQQQHNSSSPLLNIITLHFYQNTEKILSSYIKNGNCNDDDITIRMIIPILRIIGNVACAASGQFVPSILHQGTNTNTNTTITTNTNESNNSIVNTLSKWMYVINHHPSYDIMSISTEATWVCGALLCDVGYELHPSTTIACPILIPALCDVLICKNGNATLEWKREVLSALWNALSSPPNSINSSGDLKEDTTRVRDILLRSLCEKQGFVKCIVEMVKCLDIDAMQLSLYIINVIHRRVVDRCRDGVYDDIHDGSSGNIKRALDEADCLNVLEGVCDSASANVQYGSGRDWGNSNQGGGMGMDACAEMAANLIDDFYDEELDDNDLSMDVSKGFIFEVANGPQRFDFSGMRNHDGDNNMINMTLQPEVSPLSSSGRGRGRGTVTPAWMTRK